MRAVEIVIDILIISGITAVVTAAITTFANIKVIESKMSDLRDRIIRIEHYLNGLLKVSDK